MNHRFYILSALLFSGCDGGFSWTKKPVSKPGDNAPVVTAQLGVENATAKADANQAKVDTKIKEIAGQVRTNVQGALKANYDQPPSNPTTIVKGELTLADTRLSSVEPDPKELVAQAQREAMVKSGEALGAQKAYQDANSRATEANKQLGALQTERDAAITDRDAARAREVQATQSFAAQTEANGVAFKTQWDSREATNAKVVKDLKDGIAAKTQLYLTMGCYGLGVLCVIGAALRTYMAVQTGGLGLVSAAKSAGTLALFAALFFALGRLTSEPWFWYACGTVLVITVVSVVAIFVIDSKKTKALADAHQTAKSVGDDVITAISDIRNNLKHPPATLVQKILDAKTPTAAAAAVSSVLTEVVDPTLREYVTESDGTAAYVDARRRALSLVTSPTNPVTITSPALPVS
jgi:hypothetical protein